MAELEPDVFVLEPRRDRPQGRFNLVAGLSVALLASVAYVLALTVRDLPTPAVAAALFTAGPVLCLVALIIYWSVTSDLAEPAVRWAAAGIAVCFVALTLQYISFPIVTDDGGPFGTGYQSSAALYLLFHLALYAGAALGGAGLSPRWVTPSVAGGTLVALALALDVVPLPALIQDEVVFTPLLTGIDVVLLVAGAVATIAWARRAGRTTTPLSGWFGVGLALSLAELGLNAVAAERFTAPWWSSLSLRVATFAVLAFGAVGFLLRDRRRFSGYTESELHRRESQLTATGRITDALMANAVLLSRASTPEDVATTLAESVCALTACQRVLVMEAKPPHGMVVLASRGYDPASLAQLDKLLGDPATGAERLVTRRRAFYEVGAERILERYPLVARIPAEAGVGRVAVVPMEAAGVVRGTVSVSSDDVREWNDTDRAVLTALAAQGGPALARAGLHAQEHHNAEVLQRSLLPPRLPTAPGLEVACRYLPGDTAATVGGDWYDVEVLPDLRVLLTVGDVVGKGIRAAAMMGMLRQSARALARVDPGPGKVLDRLDEVGAELGDHAFATVLGILWDPRTSRIRTSRAGHPPAILVRHDGTAHRLDAGLSPPIGSPAGPRSEYSVDIAAGDHLVLYTDGLVESREVTIDDGIDELIGEARRGVEAGMSTDELADHLIGLRRHADDVALLVVRVLDEAPTTTGADVAARAATAPPPVRMPSAAAVRARSPRPSASVTLAVALVLLVATACSSGSGTGDSGPDPATPSAASHEYLPGLAAYPYLPEDVDSAPVVVLVPGGSWQSAEPAGLEPLAAALAEDGVVAVPVTIRAAKDDVVYPTPVEDILCAAADAAATARDAGIEPERLVLLGHSSGAHLSAVATLAADRFAPRCEDPVVAPDGLVGLAGPYDIRQFSDAADVLFRAPIEDSGAEWDAANPVLLAGLRRDVPVLLLHGDADDVVPVSFTTDFAAALAAGGHPTTLRVLPDEDHDTVYSAQTAAGHVTEWLAAQR